MRELDGKPFSYRIGVVLSDFKSHITRFDNPSRLLSDYYIGERIGQMWGYTVDGYFKTDEEAQAYDVNQDRVNAIRLLSPGEGKLLQRSEEHTSELQSLMRISYAVFCLKKQQTSKTLDYQIQHTKPTN